MIQIAIFIVLVIFLLVKAVQHLREKSRLPKNAQQELLDTMREARDSLSVELIESVADSLATGQVEVFSGHYKDRTVPKDPEEAERWYAMLLEEQLARRVQQEGDGSFVLFPFEQAVLRYCDGPLPRDLRKAMAMAEYLVRREVALGGVLVRHVRELMAGRESVFYKATGSGGWTAELRAFAEERARLRQADEEHRQLMRLRGGQLELVMEHEGVRDLPGRIAWLLEMAGWPAPGAGGEMTLPGGFEEALALERQGNAKAAAARYRRLGGSAARYRLGRLCRQAVSLYQEDKPWRQGTEYLRQAAAEGSAMAAYELGETPAAGEIAALAATGDLEAIEALGCLLRQGRGGTANPLIAWMIWQEGIRLLREEGDPAEGWRQDALSRLYQRQGEEDKAFHWLAVAVEKSKYPPAMYRFCLRPEVRLAPQYVEETLQAAWDAGFPKAANFYTLNRWVGDEESRAESLGGMAGKLGSSQLGYLETARVARKSKVILDPALITCCPELALRYDQTLGEIMTREKARSEEWAARQAQAGEEAAAREEKPLRAEELPWLIFDEWGRSWEKDGVTPGRYNLSAEYGADSLDEAMMFLHPFSTVGGDGVVIRDGDISGGRARAGGHEFSW